jgi:hypothetical protein
MQEENLIILNQNLEMSSNKVIEHLLLKNLFINVL